ncbi:MAG: hypothetical protein E6K70_23325 [Planctomycetota bacterium]|nr:MAG: hypothetical protein E6K70_23325 [Planctomycetota bacterium]
MPRSHNLRPIVSRASPNAAQPAAPVRIAADVPQVLTIDVSEQTVFDLSGEAAPADFGQPAMPAAARGRGPLAMPGNGEPKAEPVPVWKADCRELWYGGRLVKKFRQGAENQRAILDAFQEENWKRTIDDPLTGKGDMDRKKRLENAVQGLNALMRNPLLSFHVINAGEGVEWRVRSNVLAET